MEFMPFSLQMELGAASSAAQVEGGEVQHNWSDWYHKGHIRDGSNPSRANNHYNLFHEDIALMKKMGLQCYRMGLEWARIEPQENHIDEDAIAHYREVLQSLNEAGIKPLLTIHHFTNPIWFEERGAFYNKENIAVFLRYVELCVRSFGDLAQEYITINEPNVYAIFGYLYGTWPPGQRSIFKAMRVISNMAACHIEAYGLIHALRKGMGYGGTKVSFAHHVRVFAPENPRNPLHRFYASFSAWGFQEVMAGAFYKGVFKAPLKKPRPVQPGEYYDFIALNYYTRSTLNKIADGVKKDSPKNDLGWEIYPEGLVECAKSYYERFQKPIYITENGTCDENDSFRARYIYEHVGMLAQSGLPVERYYHWCFTDNFEWLEGESARFGLVHVDYNTQTRAIKQSGEFYSRMIAQKGVDEQLYNRYVKSQTYHL